MAGDPPRPILEAEYAIVTLPLGVLQAGAVTFTPDLPKEKRDAIDALRMGALSKTWLLFDRAFWPKDVQIIAYLGQRVGRWSSWYNFQPILKRPVLLGLNGGDVGKQIEALNHDQIWDEARDSLKKCFPSATISIQKLLQSRWTKDPYSFGSYSHIPPNSTPDHRDTLADPFRRLLFAGEATHRTCSQTVHGAVMSGWREARRVMPMLAVKN